MGACGGKELTSEQRLLLSKSRRRDQALKKDASLDSQKVKLLLLGAGESGKSTIFKQMKIIYGKDFTDDEKKEMIPTIHLNVVQAIKVLTEKVREVELESEVIAKSSFELVDNMSDFEKITPSLASAILEVWNDNAVQKVWARRSEFQIIESVKYYFDQLEIIGSPNYVPTKDDILYTRVRTSGVVTEKYDIESTPFEMYDVGGQKNERKKWIHCFDDVTAIIFVAAISEYDQQLFEDGSTNRMVDALNLFEDICSLQCFQDSAIILFLNKRDLFEQKIKKKDIASCPAFKDFRGPAKDYDAGVKYFVDKFKARNKKFKSREIYHHVTCATDTANVKVCFNLCTSIILSDALNALGV